MNPCLQTDRVWVYSCSEVFLRNNNNNRKDKEKETNELASVWVWWSQMALCGNGAFLLSSHSTSWVCLQKLLFIHQHPTQLPPLLENFPCPASERANHTLHTGTSEASTTSSTKYIVVDHLLRAKHCSKGATDIAMNKKDKELTVYKYINK